MAFTDKWDIKVVGHDVVDPGELLAHPNNWRNHPRYQQEALRSVINDVGFIRSVTVNRLTGHILDGHLRAYMALQEGQTEIPVEYVEVAPELEAEVLATFDPIAALATVDENALQNILQEIQTDQEPLQHMLARLAQGTKPKLSRFGETDEDNDSSDVPGFQVNQQRYPLPIILDQDGYRMWVRYKQDTNIRSDTQAFINLLATATNITTPDRPHSSGLWPNDE
jgi:hypothetical protein